MMPRPLPGDPTPRQRLDRILRVDHAGEYGARQIYKGQLAVLQGTEAEAPIREMAAAEDEHLASFDRLLVEHRARPTALSPLWRVAGFALGAGTALLGRRAAMACTVAVEEVIDDHYRRQVEALGDDEPALREMLEKYRADERHHGEVARAHDAERAPGYRLLRRGVRAGTRAAIWLSERV